MKVQASVRALYAEQLPLNQKLKQEVDKVLRHLATQRNWHYESRIKTELSVALKLESGRVRKPAAIEDFFACTLVVCNLTEISDAEVEIRNRFKVTERRPQHADWTHKPADAFPFDDLRLYVEWQDDPSLPPSGVTGIRFEVQVKTFLQHAWGIATHDLVYKTDDVSWSRQRIAYQIKAMLEHAEITIQEADRLAGTAALSKGHTATEELKEIIALLKELWPAELLPADLRRLAENTRTVMRFGSVKVEGLRAALEAERLRLKGILPVNISPYSIVVQSMVWHSGNAIRAALADKQRRDCILITDEMELPDWVQTTVFRNIVHVSSLQSGQTENGELL